MKNAILVVMAVYGAALAGSPDPMPVPVQHTSTLYFHNEQGGVRWKNEDDHAVVTFVGNTVDIDSKNDAFCDPNRMHHAYFVIEYQTKQIDSQPIPGYPTCVFAGVKIHTDPDTHFDMPSIEAHQTSGESWFVCDPVWVPGLVIGSDINSSQFGLSFHADQSNDGTVFLAVRISLVVIPE